MSDTTENTIEKREETIGGYKITGSWPEIVEHGERVTAAIRRVLRRRENEGKNVSSEKSDLEDFEDWRPKAEDYTDEISERTAQKASVEESDIEKEGKTVQESVDEAQSKMKNTVGSASKLEADEVKDNVTETVSHTQDATDSMLRKLLRWIEENVYKHIMTLVSPYYFDNTLINANLNDKRGEQYKLEINISDDSIRDEVRKEMERIDTDVPRWRIETETNTQAAETVDGVQNPDTTPMKNNVEEDVEKELEEKE